MKIKITHGSVEVVDKNRKICRAVEIRDALNNGDTVELTIEDLPSKDYWLLKLFKSAEEGDWRDVDRAIKNLKVQYESSDHAARRNNPR